MFEQALEQPVDERFVVGAFDGEELVGIYGFVPFGMGVRQGFQIAGKLIQLYVKPAYRGRKIGLGLTNAVLQEVLKIRAGRLLHDRRRRNLHRRQLCRGSHLDYRLGRP